ncbi:hypothetical protein A167_01668 [Alcanivorax sp. S71-1-4]|uniref:DUF4124 domain-containing protein n=1 Tax=Alcanivorax sp. S71-1-4 TaxID=1177159 RepID=UPI00135883B7|nr:DUF4124 domain-containing protein [Alcanivorax sp. S71-1-4]KAF0809597.1 hypothetical protein A167_01668 [Alcanivorax sp. S71-1-4]
MYRFISALFLAALLGCCLASHAGQIWRCQQNGQTVYVNQPCEGQGEPLELAPLGEISGMEHRPAPRRAPPPSARNDTTDNTRRQSNDGPLGYGERSRLRQLQIERDGLQRDLQRGNVRGHTRTAIQQELRDITREITPLERRARQYPSGP